MRFAVCCWGVPKLARAISPAAAMVIEAADAVPVPNGSIVAMRTSVTRIRRTRTPLGQNVTAGARHPLLVGSRIVQTPYVAGWAANWARAKSGSEPVPLSGTYRAAGPRHPQTTRPMEPKRPGQGRDRTKPHVKGSSRTTLPRWLRPVGFVV